MIKQLHITHLVSTEVPYNLAEDSNYINSETKLQQTTQKGKCQCKRQGHKLSDGMEYSSTAKHQYRAKYIFWYGYGCVE